MSSFISQFLKLAEQYNLTENLDKIVDNLTEIQGALESTLTPTSKPEFNIGLVSSNHFDDLVLMVNCIERVIAQKAQTHRIVFHAFKGVYGVDKLIVDYVKVKGYRLVQHEITDTSGNDIAIRVKFRLGPLIDHSQALLCFTDNSSVKCNKAIEMANEKGIPVRTINFSDK